MLCLCSKEDAYMCVTAEEEEEEELALCSLVIGDCLLAPQNRRSSFLGPGLTLRSLSTGPCCVTTYHLCSLAVPPSPNCSAILFYRPLRKKYSDVFASVMNAPPTTPRSLYLSARSCRVLRFWSCMSVCAHWEGLLGPLLKWRTGGGFHTAAHCCCSHRLSTAPKGMRTEPAEMGKTAPGFPETETLNKGSQSFSFLICSFILYLMTR